MSDLGSTGALSPGSDPHGQVALLLVESLLHALVERGLLSWPDALATIEVATEVVQDFAIEADAQVRRDEALRLLGAIDQTFQAYGDSSPQSAESPP